MEQTINILTERERLLDDIEKAIRQTKYPPLNGGPTIEDLVELLEGAAATIEEMGEKVAESEGNAERCDELQGAITDALDTLDDVAFELEDVKEAKIEELEKVIDSLVTKVRCVRSNLGEV